MPRRSFDTLLMFRKGRLKFFFFFLQRKKIHKISNSTGSISCLKIRRRGWKRFLFLQLNFDTVFLIRITMQKFLFYETSIACKSSLLNFWKVHPFSSVSLNFFFFFFIWNNSSTFFHHHVPNSFIPELTSGNLATVPRMTSSDKRKLTGGLTSRGINTGETRREGTFFSHYDANLECFILFAGNSIRLIGSRNVFQPREKSNLERLVIEARESKNVKLEIEKEI